MTGELSPWHWAIVIGVLILLFGAKKLPDLARGLGQSLRILRAEVSDVSRDDRASDHPAGGSSVDNVARRSEADDVPLDPPSSELPGRSRP